MVISDLLKKFLVQLNVAKRKVTDQENLFRLSERKRKRYPVGLGNFLGPKPNIIFFSDSLLRLSGYLRVDDADECDY
jgi:hypothetical protein